MHFHVRQESLPNGVHKIGRTLDRDGFPVRSNDLGKIDRRVTWTGTDIEHSRAGANTGVPPTFQNDVSPGAMLHTEPLQFLIEGTENVIPRF